MRSGAVLLSAVLAVHGLGCSEMTSAAPPPMPPAQQPQPQQPRPATASATPAAPSVPSAVTPAAAPARTANGEAVTNSLGMRLVPIPAGTFRMGCSGRQPDWGKDERGHEVRLSKGFLMGAFPVTNAEYRRFRPDHKSGEYRGYSLDGDRQPVVLVSRQDALDFCAWLSRQPEEVRAGRKYRLPTESEWEYACRAGTQTAYSWGDDFRANLANHADRSSSAVRLDWADAAADDGHAVSSPVGSFPANAWGLYDMHGNVWQWCSDRYGHDYPEGPVADPQGPTSGHFITYVLRGGSWFARAGMLRSSARIAFDPGSRREYFGFRVVCVGE